MNELLFFVTLLVNFGGIILAYSIFGKKGIFAWIAFASVMANMEVIKCIDMFGMSLTLGNVIYGTIFLATDILNEKYGKKEAKNGVWIGFFALIAFTVLTQINLLFIPNAEDFASSSMKVIFGLTPRICIASLFSYFISNTLDVSLYDCIRKYLPQRKWLWVRNNGATMISQFIDSVLFTTLAFVGVFSLPMVIKLIFTTYLIKLLVAVVDTPFLYLATKIKDKKIKEVEGKE